MSTFGEDIFKLRKRMLDAVSNNVFEASSKDMIEALLIQILNDAERNRQNCLTQAENLRKQASTIDGQAGAFASVSSIVYNVLNGFVRAAERSKEEIAEQAEEKEHTGEKDEQSEADDKPVAKKTRRKS